MWVFEKQTTVRPAITSRSCHNLPVFLALKKQVMAGGTVFDVCFFDELSWTRIYSHYCYPIQQLHMFSSLGLFWRKPSLCDPSGTWESIWNSKFWIFLNRKNVLLRLIFTSIEELEVVSLTIISHADAIKNHICLSFMIHCCDIFSWGLK